MISSIGDPRRGQTISPRRAWWTVFGFLVASLTGPFLPEAWSRPSDEGAIRALESWSAVFGGKLETFHFALDVPRTTTGTISWEFRSGGERVASRDFSVETRSGKSTEFAIELNVPPLQRDVVVEGELNLRYESKDLMLKLQKPLWVYPDDPFSDRQQWLKGLKINLFDPAGRTAEVLEAAGIPFVEVRNLESIAGQREGMVILGEGVSFEDFPAVRFAMTEAARHGIPVLCLAPAKGQLPIPGAENSNGVFPSEVSFRRHDVIQTLDRRLDWRGWPPSGKVMACGIRLKAHRNQVVGAIMEGAEGWAWLEVGYPKSRGRILICGFAMIDQWNHGPNPRYLFRRLLERLDGLEESPN